MRLFILCSLLFLTTGGLVANQPEKEFKCVAKKTQTPVIIDGNINDADWGDAALCELSFEVSPGDNSKPKQRTEFYSKYDDKYLYFAFMCYDTDPKAISAHQSDRDQIFADDFVGVMFDPYQDNLKAYEFFVNPFGIQGDLLRTGNNEDPSFDVLWSSAGKITDFGYSVEIAIPFNILRFPSKDKADWNLQVIRIYPRDSRYSFSWTPSDRNNPCTMCQSGLLTGLENVKSPLKMEILPYFVSYQSSSVENSDVPNSEMKNGKIMGRVGVGLKVNPSSDLSIETVFNPDFSQVESDAQQITVNSTFALFYSEKRPFFLEGSDLFSGQSGTFYSRMINSPSFASKINGKAGKLTYTTILAYDQRTPFIVPGEEGSDYIESDANSFSGIFRGKYALGDESYIGTTLTSRNLSTAGSQLGGVDWSYSFWTSYYFKGSFSYSATKELNNISLFSDTRKLGNSGKDAAFNGQQLHGSNLQLEFDKFAKYHTFTLAYVDLSPQYRSDLGYLNRTNSRTVIFENGYNIYPDSSFVTGGYIYVDGSMTWNHEHQQKEMFFYPGVFLQMKGQTALILGGLPVNDEIYHNKKFRNIKRFNCNFLTRPFNFLSFGLNGSYGRMINRGADPTMGFGHTAGVDVGIKPTDEIESTFSFSRYNLRDDVSRILLYDGYILRNSTNYQPLNRLFIRIITEYSSFSHTLNLYPLLTYKLNPFTLFYIGSTYTVQKYEQYTGYRQTDRQYFMKIQYLWNPM